MYIMINRIEEYNNVNNVNDDSIKIFARGELESHRGDQGLALQVHHLLSQGLVEDDIDDLVTLLVVMTMVEMMVVVKVMLVVSLVLIIGHNSPH